jgi:hypothetical protein
MLRSTHILPVLLISLVLLLSACTNRAPSLRMLDTRAGYNAPIDDEEVAIYEKARAKGELFGRYMGPSFAKVYVYPHELPSRDYFLGGYVVLKIHDEEFTFDRADDVDSNEGEADNASRNEKPKVTNSMSRVNSLKKINRPSGGSL